MKNLSICGVFCTAVLASTAFAQQAKPMAAVSNDLPATPVMVSESRTATEPQLVTRMNTYEIPVGTPIRIRLNQQISTDTNQVGDEFRARVSQPVMVNGKTLVPKDSVLNGRIMRLSEPRRIAGRPSIDLRPDYITFPDGKILRISAAVVDTGLPSFLTVNEEGRIKGGGRSKGDNVELVAGTGVGVIGGAVIGGAQGGLIGAAAGATVTTAHWLGKRHTLELPTGTELILEFNSASIYDGSAR